jgi:hypothetical protein
MTKIKKLDCDICLYDMKIKFDIICNVIKVDLGISVFAEQYILVLFLKL